MTNYKAIDCGQHSEFELAIMHKKWLTLSWQLPDEVKQVIKVKPVDLIAKDHEEFLKVIDETNKTHLIRLDYIKHTS